MNKAKGCYSFLLNKCNFVFLYVSIREETVKEQNGVFDIQVIKHKCNHLPTNQYRSKLEIKEFVHFKNFRNCQYYEYKN